MNIFKKTCIRTYQLIFKVGMKFIKFPKPHILESLSDTIKYIKDEKVLILVPSYVYQNSILKSFIEELDINNVSYDLAIDDISNPTIQLVNNYYKLYQPTLIIAIGGGSIIDLAKLLAVKLTNKKDLKSMRGVMKVRKKPVPLIAVPTTSGSGSEATVAAVVTDDETHEKYPINDPKLVPKYVVFESSLTKTLNPFLTATTGMDALTHAVECLIGKANTKQTKEDAISAIKLIFDNLELAYNEPHNLECRYNMQKAAFLAGCAFTRGYVGYVHALAHQLGGLYKTSHGLANAVLLPYVLEEFGSSISKTIELLKKELGNSEFDLLDKIKQMNKSLDIPTYIDGLKETDFDLIISRAIKEAHPLYPVPELLDYDNFKTILSKAMKR